MFQNRLGLARQRSGGRPIDLAALEARFQSMRAAPADLDAAFAEAFAMAIDAADMRADPRLAGLQRAGAAIAEAIRTDPGKTADLPCHNHHHFAEATLAMGALCALARGLGRISAAEAAIGVVAMVGHDIDHDGEALVPGEQEAHAAAKSASICRTAGVSEQDSALVADIIEATNPSLVRDNAARAAGSLTPGPFGPPGDDLRAMANEADVTASLLPSIGLAFGEALALEMRQAHHPAAAGIASYTGRLGFLRRYAGFTPAAVALGLQAVTRAQIDALAAIARADGCGELPEDGAARLDALPHDVARARYLAATATANLSPSDDDPHNPTLPMRRFLVSLTVTILTAFSVVFIVVIGSTAWATYQVTMHQAIASVEQAIGDLTALTEARTSALIEPLYAAVAVAPDLPDIAVGSGKALGASEASFGALLAMLPQVRAISAVSPDGARLQMIDLAAMTPALRAALAPPQAARHAVLLQPAAGTPQWRFLDASDHVLGQRPGAAQAATQGDPRNDLEYRTAINSPGVATTVLHVFANLGVPGISIVRHMPGGGVLGIDVALDSLSDFLAAQRISPRGTAMIIDDNGILVAHSDRALAIHGGAGGDAAGWMTIGSARDPLLHAIWIAFATGQLAPGRNITLDVAEPYRVRMAVLGNIGSPPLMVIVAAPVSDFTGPVERARDGTLLLFLVAGAVGLALITFVAHTITKPLAALTGEADAIRRFEWDRPMAVSSHITEVAGLANTMNAMKAALQTFGLYVPKDLVRQLVSGDRRARLGGERREVTVLFTDIVGFTTIADGMQAEQLMRLTSEYFERMTHEVMGASGTIDKYIGDAIMALWNAPGRDLAHVAHGCLAALRCRDLSSLMVAEFAQRGWPPLRTRFGLNSGEAVIGNVGSSDRMSYTAIGATVNMASRLEGLSKQYGSQILVGDATRTAAGPDFVFRRVDRVLPKGQRTPVDIHELLGLRHADHPLDEPRVLPAAEIAWAQDWDRIVEAYLQRRFADAAALLQATSAGRQDGLADVYARRLATLIANPPPADWDGVIAYHEK